MAIVVVFELADLDELDEGAKWFYGVGAYERMASGYENYTNPFSC